MVDVGQTLDKYELIEKVGQGGMAVVYRGLDTTLRREVAVKVLHHHLADHKEARDRFEREAHAVAKLRHENILEIFAFSGNDSDESYIVMEFIEGQTLKDFIVEHEIRFPEVGAMIAVQVCRALVHAHGLGVLHRDVKPENIMIRSDGVVKLTDFGIAQMVDLQRMTVTGQLLGSPAYMAPEHVEGGQLDFRTDVFAVGIVLYQLVCGVLPFRGKNPHEILKKIAECRYRDPELVNPRIGSELGGIIKKALAREQGDRFADVSLLLSSLDEYLRGSGLTDYGEELSRFFDGPVAYEMALKARLVDHLARRGVELVDHDRVQALELFNRVLTLEPEHAEVLSQIDKMSRQGRRGKMLAIFGGILALGGLAVVAKGTFDDAGLGKRGVAAGGSIDAAAAIDAPPAPPDAADLFAGLSDAGLADARATEMPGDREGQNDNGGGGVNRPRVDAGGFDAAVEPVVETRKVKLTVRPVGSEYRINGGEWTRVRKNPFKVDVPVGQVALVEAKRPGYEQSSIDVRPGAEAAEIELSQLPGAVKPLCDVPGVSATVNGRGASLGRARTIPITRPMGNEYVTVVFTTDDSRIDEHEVTVASDETVEVKCDF